MNTTIERLRCQYLIPASHPAPTTIQARLDSVARDYLAGVCSNLLTNLLDPHDTSFWLIRRLDVAVSLNVERLDVAAHIWGSSIVKALIRALTIADEVDQDLVRHFPHHNAYVAQFISDLVAGHAWEQWYYRTFDSLRSLSISSAILTALTREPEQIASILALLAVQGRSESVLHCLTESDARLIYNIGYPASMSAETLAHEPSLAPEMLPDQQRRGDVVSAMGDKLSTLSERSQVLSSSDRQAADIARPGENELATEGQVLSPLDRQATDMARSRESELATEGQPPSSLDIYETNIAGPINRKLTVDGQVPSSSNRQAPDLARSGESELPTEGCRLLLPASMYEKKEAQPIDSKLATEGQSLPSSDVYEANVAGLVGSKLATEDRALSSLDMHKRNVAEPMDSKPTIEGQVLSSPDMYEKKEVRSGKRELATESQLLSSPDMYEKKETRPIGNKPATGEQGKSTKLEPYSDCKSEPAVGMLPGDCKSESVVGMLPGDCKSESAVGGLLPEELPREARTVAASTTPQRAQLNPDVRIERTVTGEASTHVVHEATANEERHILELLLSAWSKASLQLSGTRIATPHNALRLYTTLWSQVSQYPFISVREVIEHVLSLAELLRISGQSIQIVSSMLDSNLTAALNLLRAANLLSYLKSLSYLQQIAVGDTALLRRIASIVAPSTVVTREIVGGTVGSRMDQRITSLLGGIFLLLPSFIDLKFHELLKHAPYPDVTGAQNTPILRCLLFLKSFGRLHAQWPDIIYDPILQLISSADDLPLMETFQQLSQTATSSMNLAWQRSLLKQQVDYHYVEGRYLYAELVEIGTGPILLMRDMHYDVWLYIRAVSQEAESVRSALLDGLALVQEVIEQPVEYLVLGAGLEQLVLVGVWPDQSPCIVWVEPDRSVLRMVWSPTEAMSYNGGSYKEQGLAQEKSTELLHSIHQLTAVDNDLRYLTLYNHTQPMIEQRDLDLTLSLFARVLMRAFARRLIGFGKSSCAYLYQNFLAGTASVLVQHDLLEVQIPRPPLHLVLRIAGMHEQSYTLPWSDRQVIVELVG